MNVSEEIKVKDFFSFRRFFGLKREDINYRPMIVMVSVAICLSLNRFAVGLTFPWFMKYLPQIEIEWKCRFYQLVYWAIWCFISYFVIPAFITTFVFKGSILKHGLKLKGIHKNAWLYLVLYSIVFVGVIIASYQQAFLQKYPFFTPPSPPLPEGWLYYFIIWELLYFSQFCFLEYFFRGYMIFELEKDFSFYSIFIMVIPYCMIHFQKPFLEALASIVAGIFLGMIALRTRSIFYGVVIHCSVALSMDVAALIRKGELLYILGMKMNGPN